MTPARWSAIAAVGLVVAFAVWWTSRPEEPPTQPPDAPAAGQPAAAKTPAAAATAPAPEAPLAREPASPDPTAADPVGAVRFPQGLRGAVVDGQNRPMAGVQVFLLESPGNEPLALPLMLQRGLATGPLAVDVSAADGTFAVGLQLANEKLYELRLLAANHADTRLGGLRVLPGEWHDVGLVVMSPGATVRGRVTVEGTELPVPQAVVSIDAGTAFEDAALRSLPGRERGLAAAVDGNGRYELRHAPTRGIVQVSAVAPGFARVIRQNIELSTDRPIEVDFGLPPGQTLSGQVVDAGGQPIARARIEAWPTHAASPALIAQSHIDGAFEVVGLTAGAHRLRVLARGYQDHDQAEVIPGRHDLRIVLQARSTLRVRVTAPNGQVVRRYQLGVRRYFADHGGQIGLLAEVADQRVRLDGLTDQVEVAGIPAGTFVCQVSADGFAKTLSKDFTVEAGGQTLDVDVALSLGATLRGIVVDEAGRPLPGATIETQAAGAAPDNPVWRMLASATPERITAAKASAAVDGTFVLPLLSLGSYQLQVDHPEACRQVVSAIELRADGELTLPPIRMVAGAVVYGKATVGGKIAGQIKVVLTTATGANGAGPAASDSVRLETVTDSSGAFRLPRRVPPGNYELRAAVVGTAEPEAQIFRQLLQLQRSSTTFSVTQGQTAVERHIDLPTDH